MNLFSAREAAVRPLGAAALLAGSCLALLLLLAFSPGYLTRQGFPLDDAWIHAVYGRELAAHGVLAYNPGVPATGETSPLWAAAIAVPHLFTSRPDLVVAFVKITGFGLHLLGAWLVFQAGMGTSQRSLVALAGASIVVLQPDLLAASVSGVEVSLAGAIGLLLLLAARTGRFGPMAMAAAVAPLARPELASLALLFPVLLFFREPASLRRCLAGAVSGTAICFGLMALRNIVVSGRPLPATFYVKFAAGDLGFAGAQISGFREMLPKFGIPGSPFVLVAIGVIALWQMTRPAGGALREAAAASLGGLAFFAVSFFAAPPVDPEAFYHQRYALPGLPLLLAGAVPLVWAWVMEAAPGRVPQWVPIVLWGATVGSFLTREPGRLGRLANDARNIDDVQVRIGHSLSTSDPAMSVWVVDAGAVRYFGKATVVDLIGLNTPEVLGKGRELWLSGKRPTLLEFVAGWNELDSATRAREPAGVFQARTDYTVTSFPAMATHVLYPCPAGASGWVRIRGKRLDRFDCAPAGRSP